MQWFLDMTKLDQMTVQHVIMILIGCFFLYLSIGKKYEPMLLLPLAVGMILANIPGANLSAYATYPVPLIENGVPVVIDGVAQVINKPGLLNIMYSGISYVVYPPFVFLCIGIMTDFGPLISAPRNFLISIGAQLGIFTAFGLSLFVGSLLPGFEGFSLKEAAAIGIIGGADGPTAVYAATRLAPGILSSVAIAAFSYMALVPFIQPPLMRFFTTDKERVIVMPEPKKVTHRQKIIFPIAVTIITLLLIPAAGNLVGMLMLGNIIRESGVVERYVKSFSSHILNGLTLLVGLTIGSSAEASRFLTPQTIIILACGLVAFVVGTIGGILTAKLLCWITRGKVNPLIGNAGVSAMPMAARISQRMGQKYNPQNYLLMHAMGPLVGGVLGSSICAGLFLTLFT